MEIVNNAQDVALLMEKIRQDVSRRRKAKSQAQTISGEPHSYRFGETLHFREGSPDLRYLREGWSHAEPAYVWSDDSTASWEAVLEHSCDLLLVELVCVPFVGPQTPAQRVQLWTDMLPIAEWRMDKAGTYYGLISRTAVRSQSMKLVFHFPDAVSPISLGVNEDPRRLAVALQQLTITPFA